MNCAALSALSLALLLTKGTDELLGYYGVVSCIRKPKLKKSVCFSFLFCSCNPLLINTHIILRKCNSKMLIFLTYFFNIYLSIYQSTNPPICLSTYLSKPAVEVFHLALAVTDVGVQCWNHIKCVSTVKQHHSINLWMLQWNFFFKWAICSYSEKCMLNIHLLCFRMFEMIKYFTETY